MFLPLSRVISREILQTPQYVSKRNSRHWMVYILLNGFCYCCCCCCFKIGISYHLMKKPVSSSNYPGPSSGRHKSTIHVNQAPFFCPSPCPNLFVQFMLRLLLLHKSALTPVLTEGRLFPVYLEGGTSPMMLRLLVFVSLKMRGWVDRLTSCAVLHRVWHMEGTESTLNG